MPSNNIPPTQQLLTYQPNQPIFAKDIQAAIRYLLEVGGTGTGDVVGTPPSTLNAIALYSDITGLLIKNSLATVSAAGTLNIPAGQNFTIGGVPLVTTGLSSTGTVTGATAQAQAFTLGITSTGGGNTTTLTNGQVITGSAGGTASMASGGIIYSSDNAGAEKRTSIQFDATTVTDNAVTKVLINTSGVKSGDGLVGTPSLSFVNQTDMGLYRVSATQMGISVAGVLQATVDSAIGGIAVGAISELVGAAGIFVTGSLLVGTIGDDGSGILTVETQLAINEIGERTVGAGTRFLNIVGVGSAPSASTGMVLRASTTSLSSLRILSGVAPTSPVNGDIWQDGTNIFMRMGGTTKTFTLV